MSFSRKSFAMFAVWFLVGTIFYTNFVFAASYGTYSSQSAYSSSYASTPSFQTYYDSNDIDTYWPILGNEEVCEGRNDLMLQVPPAGCDPPVVRSDLLAEQNVPVFCQINAININPLIDIEQIQNMQFTGDYPPEVAGSGFHPARAALRTYDTLLGSPLMNNIGYVVVVLKQQPVESELPEFVNVTLTAKVEYVSGNAYGVGRSEFVLEQVSDADWETEKLKQTFWNGRYSIRLNDLTENYAEVSIYNGDQRAITTRINRGETTQRIFVPGMYCQAGLQISFDEIVSAKEKARIEVSSGNDFDVFDVYEGSRFLDSRCSISRINIGESGETGSVVGSCGSEKFELVLGSRNESSANKKGIVLGGEDYVVKEKSNGEYVAVINESVKDSLIGDYILEVGNNLVKEGEFGLVIASDGGYGSNVLEGDKEWYNQLYQTLISFRTDRLGLGDSVNVTKSMRYFDAAVDAYEDIADTYPYEVSGEYGMQALDRAITLARLFGRDQTRIRLIEKYLDLYSEGENVQTYLSSLNRIKEFDTSEAGVSVRFDDKDRVIRLLSLSDPSNKGKAYLNVEGTRIVVQEDEPRKLMNGEEERGQVELLDLSFGTATSDYNRELNNRYVGKASLAARCYVDSNDGKTKILSSSRQRYELEVDGGSKEVCGMDLSLEDVDVKQAAKIRLTPVIDGTETESNITVNIGIEKRAIELTPDKVRDQIDELNKTIEDWENIVDKLGEVVKGLKGACFATAALLTFKNFIAGLNGETLARQKVMQGETGWTKRCKTMVANKEKGYETLDECFIGEADNIDAEVAATTSALEKVNSKIQAIQNQHITDSGVLGLDNAVDTEAVRSDLAQEVMASCQGFGDINMGGKTWQNQDGIESETVSVSNLVTQSNVENGIVTTDALRELLLNCELKKSTLSDTHSENVNGQLKDIAESVNSQMIINWESLRSKELEKRGYPSAFFAGNSEESMRATQVVPITQEIRKQTGLTDEDITHIAVLNAGAQTVTRGDSVQDFSSGLYVLGLQGDSTRGIYNVNTVVKQDDTSETYTGKEVAAFTGAYGIGSIKAADRLSYTNEIQKSDRYVRYYEREPYKGMPAIVPFNVREGWYAATKQTLPTFGGIGAFDDSGQVTSFWVCNVGENGKIEINSGYGDDLCQQINLQTGQSLNAFPGLSSTKASSLIQQAQRAIEEAANQYGNKYVTVLGERIEVGEPEVGVAGTNCQDFMSPKDCHLMFNVCDPVICPASRCDFGGTYRVADVVQTGIIGSALLCLPNFKEGIVFPVCLTGIHAGIDALVSIMRNYRDCLQENLDSGEMVGICDQIYSIYLCEFFWNQVAPFVNVLIPKLIELAYGQGTRGGAEYLSVMSAWQNMESSIDYFTQSYAVNAIEAFQTKSIQEVGTEVCQVFISAKAPEIFDSLIEPESPAQFHAWFDEKTFTSATVPATSQYKVFYHIYAGNDQGATYNVYLKNPPQSGYYSVSSTVPVANGYINRGEYASETKDFTAPEGYQELCVRINNDEECGFAQVSSSFAVNYLRDSWVSDELQNTDITSATECVSGSNNVGSLIQPNVQAGVEEFVSPEIYNRGVIRICATDNPGKSTDSSRYVDVGYCDDEKVRCWIDQRSVENAITDANIGLINETLEVLDERARQVLEAQNLTLSNSTALDRIRELQDAMEKLRTSDSKEADAATILTQVDILFDEFFWNHHKARLLLIKGETNEIVALSLRPGEDEAKRAAVSDESVSSTSGSDSGEVVYTLGDDYKVGKRLVLNGADSDYYVGLTDGRIYLVSDDTDVGGVTSSGIIVLSSEGGKYVDGLRGTTSDIEGAKIEGWGSSSDDSESICSDCRGLTCQRDDCEGLGDGCLFIANPVGSGSILTVISELIGERKCFDCDGEIISCVGYNEKGGIGTSQAQDLCQTDDEECNFKCGWDEETGICYGTIGDSLEGIVPCRDGEGRVKADLSFGSYGYLNGELQYYSDSWSGNVLEGDDWDGKSLNDKENLVRIRTALSSVASSPAVQSCEGEGDETPLEELPLALEERFVVKPEGSNYVFYSHLKNSEALEPTGLYARGNALPVLLKDSSGSEVKVATLDRPFFSGDDKIFIQSFESAATGKTFSGVSLTDIKAFVLNDDATYSIEL